MQNRADIASAELNAFVQQSLVEAFFEKCFAITGCKHVCTINKTIAEVIVQDSLFPGRDDADDDGELNEDSAERLSPGDRGMKCFEPEHMVADDGTNVVSCYTVT